MKQTTTPLALACAVSALLLGACTADDGDAPAARPAAPATATETGDEQQAPAGNTRLTIYSGNYDVLASGQGGGQAGHALVQRDLRFELQAGANRVAIGEFPVGIDVAATSLRPTTPGVSVGTQRFIAPLSGAQEVFARATGRRVAVDHTSGGARQTDNGILVAVGDGVTLALTDGRYKVIREFDSLSVLDTTDLPGAEPQLRWEVQAEQTGPAGFLFEHPTGGLAWRAEYVGRIADAEDPDAACQLALTGYAMIVNHSGTRFDDAALTLVAGEPNREPDARKYARATAVAAPPPAPMMEQASMPVERRSAEYHAYDLPGRTDLANGGIERVALFAPVPAVDCERRYETQPALQPWLPPRPLVEPGFNDSTGTQPVAAVVEFANTEDAGLGRALPEGRVRMFDGEAFLGESSLAHTPKGADIRLEVGTAFDLTAERERMRFDLDRAGRTMTESFQVTLANAGDEDATIIVTEPMPRWSDWEVTTSSVPATRRDAQHAEFEVTVPADGETVLTYTVRYRWPAGMRL